MSNRIPTPTMGEIHTKESLFNRTGDCVGYGAEDSAGGTFFFADSLHDDDLFDSLHDDPVSSVNPFEDDPF